MLKSFFFILIIASVTALSANDKTTQKLICPQKTDPPPVIDGDISEWLSLPGEIIIAEKHVQWGKAKWRNEDDLSGSFRLCWDANYLYVLAEVIDDKLVVTQSGKDLYKTDHIEIDIDTDYKPDAKGSYTAKQFLIAVSPGNMEDSGDPLTDIEPEFYIYHPVNLNLKQNIDVASKSTENGYVIELRVPWETFGIKPEKGLVIGIDLHFSDTDESENQESLTTLSSGKWLRRDRKKLQAIMLTDASGKSKK